MLNTVGARPRNVRFVEPN